MTYSNESQEIAHMIQGYVATNLTKEVCILILRIRFSLMHLITRNIELYETNFIYLLKYLNTSTKKTN